MPFKTTLKFLTSVAAAPPLMERGQAQMRSPSSAPARTGNKDADMLGNLHLFTLDSQNIL